jgi:transketolase
MPLEEGKPTLIIANTTKGKGVSYMENVKKWHHGVPSDEQYELAMNELNTELERLSQVISV